MPTPTPPKLCLGFISHSRLHNPQPGGLDPRTPPPGPWGPPAGLGASLPQCTARGASLERDDDGGGRCTRSDHTAGKRCQSFNGENFILVSPQRGGRHARPGPCPAGFRCSDCWLLKLATLGFFFFVFFWVICVRFWLEKHR